MFGENVVNEYANLNGQVGLPYLRAKAQDYYEELGGGIDSDIIDEGSAMRQTRALSDQVRTSGYTANEADVQLRTRRLWDA